MRRRDWVAAGTLTLCAVFGTGVVAGAQTNEQVCEGLDSGKIDVPDDQLSITVTAPDGFLIDGYCAKAGSENQGEGPETFVIAPPVAELTITHSSGKELSHYSVSYVPVENGTTTTMSIPPPPPPGETTTTTAGTLPPGQDTVPPSARTTELAHTGSRDVLVIAGAALVGAGVALAGRRRRTT